MKTVFLGLLVPITAIVNAQPSVTESQQNLRILTGNSTYRANALQGTPVVFEDFLPGAFTTTSGQEFTRQKINYDALNDQVIIAEDSQDRSEKLVLILSFYVIRNSDTLFFERLIHPGKVGFYQRLMDGPKVKLYKKHVRRLEPPASSGAFGTGKTVPEFVSSTKYFVLDGTLPLQEFKKRKSLLELFPKEEEQLIAFIDERKIDFQEEKDLIALIAYINRLRLETDTK